MANTILKQFNELGAKLGYPFYVYPDGTCGKSIVSGKMNMAIMVKNAFSTYTLKVSGSSANMKNEICACLMDIGDKIGFPFYIYSDGTCGVKAVSPINNLPFVMAVKKKIEAHRLMFDDCISSKRQENDKIQTAENELFYEMSADKKNDVLAQARVLIDEGKILDGAYEEVFLSRALDKEIEAYFENHKFSESILEKFIKRGNKNIILALIKYQELSEKNQVRLVEYSSDDVVLLYCQNHCLGVEALARLNQMKRYSLLFQILDRQDDD